MKKYYIINGILLAVSIVSGVIGMFLQESKSLLPLGDSDMEQKIILAKSVGDKLYILCALAFIAFLISLIVSIIV